MGSEDSYSSVAICIGTLLLYLILTSQQKLENDSIKIGNIIPTFSGTLETGKSFDSSSLANKRVIIKFYRGFW